MSQYKLIQWRRLIILILVLVLTVGCEPKTPILIGFTAELTGKQSEAGINLQYGVQMAVDDINARDGIHGRKIKLLIEDDHGTAEGARTAETRLIDAGAIAVIGHYTSSQTIAGYQVAEKRKVLLISATASSAELSGKKDLFFRTVVSTDTLGKAFARYISQQRKLLKIAILYDQDNNAYAAPLIESFSGVYAQTGGVITAQAKFSASSQPDFTSYVEKLRNTNPNALFIIASPTNTALIAQVVRLQNWSVPLFSSSWGQGVALIQNGGKAVENMEMIMGLDSKDDSAGMEAFMNHYQNLYGHLPGFTAIEGYDTMEFLARGLLLNNGSAKGLAEALMKVEDFQGLAGPVRIDENGDAIRDLFIQRIQNQDFVTVDRLAADRP